MRFTSENRIIYYTMNALVEEIIFRLPLILLNYLFGYEYVFIIGIFALFSLFYLMRYQELVGIMRYHELLHVLRDDDFNVNPKVIN